MKIKVQGKKPIPVWCGDWDCRTCGSVITVEPDDDVGSGYSDEQYDGVSLKMTCPVCEAERYLYRHKEPPPPRIVQKHPSRDWGDGVIIRD